MSGNVRFSGYLNLDLLDYRIMVDRHRCIVFAVTDQAPIAGPGRRPAPTIGGHGVEFAQGVSGNVRFCPVFNRLPGMARWAGHSPRLVGIGRVGWELWEVWELWLIGRSPFW